MTRHLLRCSLWLLLLSGCGSQLQGAHDSIATLRARAAAAPNDPNAAAELALAELFSYEGDPAKADAALERARSLDGENVRIALAGGLAHDVHGRPGRALEAYLAALALATDSRDPIAPQLAELAAHAIAGLEGAAPGYAGRVEAALPPLLDQPKLTTPARFTLGSLLIDHAYRRGDRPAGQQIAERIGCVTGVRAIGPFGPRDLLGFDRQHPAKPGAPLAQQYDLGPNRGFVPTRELGARGCSINLGGGPLAQGGTTYAQAYVDTQQSAAYVIRLQVPSSAELFVDGRSLLRLDRRKQLLPDEVYVPVELARGRHELTLKLTTRHPNPVLSLAVSPARPGDAAAIAMPFTADARSGFARYVRATTGLARGDLLTARRSLHGIGVKRPAAPLLMMQRASLLLADPLLPNDQREDDARELFGAALRRDPLAWNPAVQLAGMMAGNGRVKEAIAALREAMTRWPEVPAIGLTLADLLRKQQWDAEADAVIARVRKLVPDACAPLSAELDALRRRQREQAAEATVEALMRCEAQANSRYALLLRKRQWEPAERELDRLQALEPPQVAYAWLLARLELKKNRGDAAAVERMIGELRAQFPRSVTAALEQVDLLAGRGDGKRALEVLGEALRDQPASMAELHKIAPALGGAHVMAAYRRDGKQAIERFEASGRRYEGPQVLVFDYMAARVFPDGSSVELVHTIQKAQSDESVDELGEVDVPEGAEVLKLHTIKPNGDRLEPDEIEGKDAVSLPTVVPGDYVEFEYVVYKEPSQAFPLGYSGDRFFFKSFEIPFDHSEMVVVVPPSLAVKNDARGPAPVAEERTADGLRVLTYKVDESQALKVEPGAVSAKEYLPSIRIGVRAEWPSFIESISDVLVDRDLYDPEIAALARQIVGDAAPGDHKLRAQRLYAWVLEHIENNEDVFSQAALMLRARSGNRARVLHYLLELAGVPAELALARSAVSDSTPSDMADADTYEHLLVRFGEPKAPTWLFTVERFAPFGYLPPLLQGQPALLLADGARSVTVPTRPGQELRHLQFQVKLNGDGSAQIDANESVRGTGAVSWRSELQSVPDAELEQRFEAEYVARLLPGARLRSVEIPGREQVADSIELTYAFELAALGRRVGKGWALPPMVPAELAHNYAQLSQRTTTQLIGSPLELDVVLRIELPKGAGRPALPAPVRLQAEIPGKPRFSMTSRYEKGGVLVVERKLTLPMMRVTPEDYPAFASFCRSVDAAEDKELVVGLPR